MSLNIDVSYGFPTAPLHASRTMSCTYAGGRDATPLSTATSNATSLEVRCLVKDQALHARVVREAV